MNDCIHEWTTWVAPEEPCNDELKWLVEQVGQKFAMIRFCKNCRDVETRMHPSHLWRLIGKDTWGEQFMPILGYTRMD